MNQQPTQPASRVSLDALAPGFADPVHDTQAVFRALLDALARPGSIGTIETPLPAADANGVARAGLAACASLLALCDYATPVWLAQPDPALAAALRFHADAPFAASAADAAFVYVHDAAALPPLDAFHCGTPESPETSATVLVRVDALTGGAPLTLSGPGIDGTRTIAPAGLPARFWPERAALAPLFPCGLDFYLVCGASLIGLPRTTHVEIR
ncbi:phosphonate C-P lyase system protein PhnH [Paraburkholderia caballeronis]|uniref:phosphonate C-P lyase system protein PhnH n=1 Tax=Paraburkholderia caballeronis TaxID=416943 RepID=UPI0010651AEF|nr:phosphonate C-P lyase system protein PhnH [Paraburkholderia caballeronis]TDV15058.1 alpha-D-ribose 1-methylphosphonate 5-triphosphate synthase subunit PhnH [Paraburkholderia caballeronis]TDV16817.1 alpha-D-ribose 1-methylphosphonate 5-triphosphate synthase subunit PhnH [Paraburkholderia caballeronis]TDV25794.1 alpha-D-ribose 1-methylphosphonate 5-triphosphate synthase subunit PhnH [Paraburkholderia caballeronis]